MGHRSGQKNGISDALVNGELSQGFAVLPGAGENELRVRKLLNDSRPNSKQLAVPLFAFLRMHAPDEEANPGSQWEGLVGG